MMALVSLLLVIPPGMQETAEELARQLVERLRSDKTEERGEAAQKLQEMEGAARPWVLEASRSPDPALRQGARRILATWAIIRAHEIAGVDRKPGDESRVCEGGCFVVGGKADVCFYCGRQESGQDVQMRCRCGPRCVDHTFFFNINGSKLGFSERLDLRCALLFNIRGRLSAKEADIQAGSTRIRFKTGALTVRDSRYYFENRAKGGVTVSPVSDPASRQSYKDIEDLRNRAKPLFERYGIYTITESEFVLEEDAVIGMEFEEEEFFGRVQKALEEVKRRSDEPRPSEAKHPSVNSVVPSIPGERDLKVPEAFKRGALECALRETPALQRIPLDDRMKKKFEGLARRGCVKDLVRRHPFWMPYILDALLSDDEKLAGSALQALDIVCGWRGISACRDGFTNPVPLRLLNSAYVRGMAYVLWSEEWWAKPENREAVRAWGRARVPPRLAEAARTADWDELMRDLRPGGGYDDPKRPEGAAFARVKAMGPAALPHLVRYVADEDVMLAKAAVNLLNKLTERNEVLPTEATKERSKAQWEGWIAFEVRPLISRDVVRLLTTEATEENVRTLLEGLTSDDVAIREKSAHELERCLLAQRDLLRKAYQGSGDAEINGRIAKFVDRLEVLEDEEADLRTFPELLLDFLEALPKKDPDFHDLWARAGRLYRKLKQN